MAKIIPFNPREGAEKRRIETLVAYADKVDSLNLEFMSHADSKDLIAVMANRLSELIRLQKSEKSKVWETCKTIIEDHAGLSGSSK